MKYKGSQRIKDYRKLEKRRKRKRENEKDKEEVIPLFTEITSNYRYQDTGR